jgi:arsenite methyltransferase
VTQPTDQWHRWLRELRHGGDPDYAAEVRRALVPVRDSVLDGAELRPDDTLLDVGTGDGLIAFGALDRLGPAGRVIFSDISADLLDHCRAAASAAGQLDRCSFVRASADRLEAIGDASVDVVTTRAVLIYVTDKAAAFAEFRRVLRPGGRVSVYEPINTLMHGNQKLFLGYDIGPVAEIAAKVAARFDAVHPPGTDPMLDFDDRDLVRLAEQAGFGEVRLDLRVTVTSTRSPVPWDRFLRSSPNPKVPPIGEVLGRALSADELAAFTAHLRPLVESGRGEHRRALAHLTAGDSADQLSPAGPPG